MAWWWELLPIPSPLDGGIQPDAPLPNIEHDVIRTKKGRVVYNRKPHKFTKSDVLRVAAAAYDADPKQTSGLMLILEELTIYMIDRIISLIGPNPIDKNLAERLYYYLRDTLARIIDKLPKEVSKQADEFLNNPYGV